MLTPWHPEHETDKWTVYMFINPTTQEGVIQAFRQERCEDESVTIRVRGVEMDKYYTVIDMDGRNSAKSVKEATWQKALQSLSLKREWLRSYSYPKSST